MRWPAYFVLAYVMVGIQLGAASLVPVRGVGPDLVLLVVVFVALNAPAAEATVGALLLVLQDLVTLQPLGLFAFAYGATAFVVARSAEYVRRGHPLTHVALALVGGLITGVLLVAHDYVRPVSGPVSVAGTVVAKGYTRVGPRTAVVSALYTAALAPLLIVPLMRLNRLFGFGPPNRRRPHS